MLDRSQSLLLLDMTMGDSQSLLLFDMTMGDAGEQLRADSLKTMELMLDRRDGGWHRTLERSLNMSSSLLPDGDG